MRTDDKRSQELRKMADQMDADQYGHGFAAAALREYAALIEHGLPETISSAVQTEVPTFIK